MNELPEDLTRKIINLLHADLQPRPRNQDALKAALAALSAVSAALIAGSHNPDLLDWFGRLLFAHLAQLGADPDSMPAALH